MITRQKAATYGIPSLATATIITAALLAGRDRSPPTPPSTIYDPPVTAPQQGPSHDVDVVFAIDTTVSMSGMIEGAKKTVWSIATHIKQVDPSANVRMGLVAYRDIGDDYVTKDFMLSSDLDAMFANLTSLQADGGNDIPEDVDAGLYDAVHKMPWRPGAHKMVFVVGDAQPATRGDVPAYTDTAREAANSGIIVNTIRVGSSDETRRTFAMMAQLGGGEFSSTQENGNVQAVVTPYDAKLTELSRTIDATAIIVGDDNKRAEYDAKVSANAAAPAAVAADRAGYWGTGARDSADALNEGGKGIEGVKPEELPADLRGMSKGDLAKEVARRAAQRAAANAKITELNAQRADYLKKHAVYNSDGFDTAVNHAVENALK